RGRLRFLGEAMNIADAFEKLEVMHESGGLTDAELAAVRRSILAIDEDAIEAEIEELKRHKRELEQLDHDWQVGGERYMVTEKFGDRSIPSRWGSVVNAVVILVFGVVWIAVSLGRTPVFFTWLGVFACAYGLAVPGERSR